MYNSWYKYTPIFILFLFKVGEPISSQAPRAIWTNHLRDRDFNFNFNSTQKAIFTCTVVMEPAPTSIMISVDGTVISNQDSRVANFSSEAIGAGVQIVWFEVNKVRGKFSNCNHNMLRVSVPQTNQPRVSTLRKINTIHTEVFSGLQNTSFQLKNKWFWLGYIWEHCNLVSTIMIIPMFETVNTLRTSEDLMGKRI